MCMAAERSHETIHAKHSLVDNFLWEFPGAAEEVWKGTECGIKQLSPGRGSGLQTPEKQLLCRQTSLSLLKSLSLRELMKITNYIFHQLPRLVSAPLQLLPADTKPTEHPHPEIKLFFSKFTLDKPHHSLSITRESLQ